MSQRLVKIGLYNKINSGLVWRSTIQTFTGVIDTEIKDVGLWAYGNYGNKYGKWDNVRVWFPIDRIDYIEEIKGQDYGKNEIE